MDVETRRRRKRRDRLEQCVDRQLGTPRVRGMLEEYFSIVIEARNGADASDEAQSLTVDNAVLSALPVLIEDYVPELSQLPLFLLHLATRVDWSAEKVCFRGIAELLAQLYALREPLKDKEDDNNEGDDKNDDNDDELAQSARWKSVHDQIEHFLFPQIRDRNFAPPASMISNRAFIEIASLEKLYRIFERC